MNEPAPWHAGEAQNWLHEQGNGCAQAGPAFDSEESLPSYASLLRFACLADGGPR